MKKIIALSLALGLILPSGAFAASAKPKPAASKSTAAKLGVKKPSGKAAEGTAKHEMAEVSEGTAEEKTTTKKSSSSKKATTSKKK